MALFFRSWPISHTTELCCMSVTGLIYAVTENSIFSIRRDLNHVWDAALPRSSFSGFMENTIKCVLSYIVLLRNLTAPLYVLSYVFILWSIFFEEKPALMVPWMMLSVVRNIVVDCTALIVGSYICNMSSVFSSLCIEFLLVKTSEILVSAYMWKSVHFFYHEMMFPSEADDLSLLDEERRMNELALRRRKCRSMISETHFNESSLMLEEADYDSACSLISQEDTNLFTKTMISRSLDSLLTLLLFDAEMFDSMLERRSEEEQEDDEDFETISLQEKATRFLRLTQEELNKVTRKKPVKKKMYVEVGTQVNTLSRRFLRSMELAAEGKFALQKEYEMEREVSPTVSNRMVIPSAEIVQNVTGCMVSPLHSGIRFQTSQIHKLQTAQIHQAFINKVSTRAKSL